MATRPDLAGLVADLAFDGHPTRNFAEMTAEERLDDLSRKIALVLELWESRVESEEKTRKDS